MNAKRFLDTNILVYAYDVDAPAKRSRAIQLVNDGWKELGSSCISVQVLQELHVSLIKRGLAQKDASQVVRDFASWPIVENSFALLLAALAEQTRWQLSLWDALILAAARESGATELISEDFSHGQDYGGIHAVNPFK